MGIAIKLTGLAIPLLFRVETRKQALHGAKIVNHLAIKPPLPDGRQTDKLGMKRKQTLAVGIAWFQVATLKVKAIPIAAINLAATKEWPT